MTIQLTANDQLREHIIANLARHKIQNIDSTNSKHASVAVTVVNRQIDANVRGVSFTAEDADQAAIILTTRASNLRHHAGQWAFPGGRIDAGESAEQTALRELHEEVGLKLSPENILGRLDNFATRSGFVITPIVVWGGCDMQLVANPDEVESIHRIPVSELLRPDAPVLESIPESEFPVLKMPIGNHWIAAPTAAMAYQFKEVAILGKQTRVAHFEQPVFAWK